MGGAMKLLERSDCPKSQNDTTQEQKKEGEMVFIK